MPEDCDVTEVFESVGCQELLGNCISRGSLPEIWAVLFLFDESNNSKTLLKIND